MIRRLVAGLIVVGLAVGIWALWPREDSDTTPTTLPVAVESTTTTTNPVTSSTVVDTTTTSEEGSNVVTTVEEAEAILRELWFGWFEGIYNQDEERIKEVVGNPDQLEAAVSQFGQLELSRLPTSSDFALSNTELLQSTDNCTAVWSDVSIAGFTDAVIEGVHVFRRSNESWLFISLWTHPDDLWRADCDAQL